MKIVLLGQIASGKGTISQALQEKYAFEPVSIGLLLREETKSGSEEAVLIQKCQENGELVPNDLTLRVLQKHLQKLGDKNIIFDGYPRNIAQAESLEKIAKIDHVIFLNISDDIVKERFLGRRECEKCGYVSNINYPEYNGICPRCSGKLVTRNDFSEQAMMNKMNSFEKDTRPLVEFYKSKGLLEEIDAGKGKDFVLKTAEDIIKNEK